MNYTLKIHTRKLDWSVDGAIAAVHPLEGNNEYLLLTTTGCLYRANTQSVTTALVSRITAAPLQLDKPLSLRVSPDDRYAIVCNTIGRFGLVLELATGRITMELLRDDYYPEETEYPAAFFVNGGKMYLVHATEWNRLDISDPENGRLLTVRQSPNHRNDNDEREEHYLDFFHGRLTVSPDQEWILEDGWAWHPYGWVTAWKLDDWLHRNVWESEDGPSKLDLWRFKEDWNDGGCWLDARNVALIGTDTEMLEDEDTELRYRWHVRIVEVPGGKVIRRFDVPQGGKLHFDRYLFLYSDKLGMRIYNLDDGTELYTDGKLLIPRAFHSVGGQFISIMDDEWYVCGVTE